jgi:hypothetical protein
MLTTRRPVRCIVFRSTTLALDPQFPPAGASERFDGYARAEWRRGQEWMNMYWSRAVDSHSSMHDAREGFRALAYSELGRPLRVQEEQLLGAILHETWSDHGGDLPDILPYWSHPAPFSPLPAA